MSLMKATGLQILDVLRHTSGCRPIVFFSQYLLLTSENLQPSPCTYNDPRAAVWTEIEFITF